MFSGNFFKGKIKELFSKDSINNKTVLVLVNAVYFKAVNVLKLRKRLMPFSL